MRWRIFPHLKPKQDKTIPFLTWLAFLLTFAMSRLITYVFPALAFEVRGVHVHHFAYGIILLSILGLIMLNAELSYNNRLRLSVLYGIALGLAFDEFAMWLELDDIYHDRRSIDAVIFISTFFLNFIYFEGFWRKWGARLDSLLRILFIKGPTALWRLVQRIFW